MAADGTAVDATSTGTVMTMLPMAAPAAMLQPASVLPPAIDGATHVSVPPVALIAVLFNVMPVGKMSDKVIGLAVALLATLIVMV